MQRESVRKGLVESQADCFSCYPSLLHRYRVEYTTGQEEDAKQCRAPLVFVPLGYLPFSCCSISLSCFISSVPPRSFPLSIFRR